MNLPVEYAPAYNVDFVCSFTDQGGAQGTQAPSVGYGWIEHTGGVAVLCSEARNNVTFQVQYRI